MLGRIGVICLFTIDLFKMLRRMSLPVKKTINCSYKNNSMILKNISKFVLLHEKDDHINFRRQSSKRLELPKFCLKISRFFQSMTERMKKWFLKRSPLILKNSIFIVFGSARRGDFKNFFWNEKVRVHLKSCKTCKEFCTLYEAEETLILIFHIAFLLKPLKLFLLLLDKEKSWTVTIVISNAKQRYKLDHKWLTIINKYGSQYKHLSKVLKFP